GYRRYEWKLNNLNQPSHAAAKRFGFSFEGIFRNHMVAKGLNRDTAWYAMIDKDWPLIKAALEGWLHPDNFDSNGVQIERLEAIRERLNGRQVEG
ncbi:MAG: GNAT family N-acetyltransferase, partial [Notoacmeibacter sp.]